MGDYRREGLFLCALITLFHVIGAQRIFDLTEEVPTFSVVLASFDEWLFS